jgi:hypothetical protein
VASAPVSDAMASRGVAFRFSHGESMNVVRTEELRVDDQLFCERLWSSKKQTKKAIDQRKDLGVRFVL